MSTVKAFNEFQRSWSEENLARIEMTEKIEKLEAEVKAKDIELEKLAEANKTIEALNAELGQLRARMYDSQRVQEKQLNVIKALKAKKKRAVRKSKAQASLTKNIPGKCKSNSAADTQKAIDERNAEWEKAIGPALNLLEALDKEDNEQVLGEDEVNSGADKYEFDLKALAGAIPGISLRTALEAQSSFVAADTNGNGLLDVSELKQALHGSISAGAQVDTDGKSMLEAAMSSLGMSPDQEFDFVDSVNLIVALEANLASPPGSPIGDVPKLESEQKVQDASGTNKSRRRLSTMSRRKSTRGDNAEVGSKACILS